MTKSLALAITQIYPHLTPFVDFRVFDDGSGQQILNWTASVPQPTQQQLDSAWLIVARNLKIDELRASYQNAISGTFASSALGVAHTYLAVQAQENYNSEVHRYLIDPTYTSTLVDTVDAGLLSHTKTQFFQVFMDGHDFVISQRVKLDNYITQVSTATETQLSTINWA